MHRLRPDAWEAHNLSAYALVRYEYVVIYMHTVHAWLTVQMLWQMHGRTLQTVHMLPMGNGPGLQHGFGDVFRAVISAFSMSGESKIACLSCLRAMTLRSHRNQRTRQQADALTI